MNKDEVYSTPYMGNQYAKGNISESSDCWALTEVCLLKSCFC